MTAVTLNVVEPVNHSPHIDGREDPVPEGPPDAPGTPGAGGPLADLLVVDLSRALAGPYATLLLGDLGARVI